MAKTISIQEFLNYMNQPVVPIEGLNIPNITVPAHLVSKKRETQASDTISVNIRFLFTSLTAENLPQVKEELHRVICEKVKNAKMLEEVAHEIVDNFVKRGQNIKNYMHLLNMVSRQCLTLSDENTTQTIGYYFLEKCRDMITVFISEDNIKKLAQMDQYDDDDLDAFNREREKINNLITTICCLYEQRHTSNIKLTAYQLYPLINNHILEKHSKYLNLIKDLDEFDDDYQIYGKICNIYAEQIYVFLLNVGEDFLKDEPIQVKEKTYKMKDIVEKFKTNILPNITESFLVSICNNLKCLN